MDAYNFSSDSAGGITHNSKTLINASVLGLIFEKINGYKDGSFFTPGFITEYMAKETVERTVIAKFNEAKGWKCKNLDELADKIEDRAEANEIFNTIRICDPAVGSGHFLVSVLNRLLFIKSYLDILLDKNCKRIKRGDWELRLENDEISILDEDGNPFVYTTNSERQRVQETIFAEKSIIIENCLFGVDINPASVYICRLRLWIELLKNAYYTKQSGYTRLETLPNIDINIKCGNSLVSKYVVCMGSSVIEQVKNDETKSKEFKKLVNEYKKAVSAYKNENNVMLQRLTGINEKYRLKATIIPDGIYIANSVNNLTFQNNYSPKILLALFNSKLLNLIFKATSTSSNVNGYEVDALPLPQLSEANAELQKEIISLADQILAAKKANSSVGTTAFENKIDELVYKLYGLTEEEIAIVESV